MFAACAASETLNGFFIQNNTTNSSPPITITVMEATKQLMAKVKISGGGRCNVMHDDTKTTKEILECYPRGQKEISGIFNKRFTPSMVRAWFESRGVLLKTENDGRMFPVTDSSQTIIDTIKNDAMDRGLVQIKQGMRVQKVRILSNGQFAVSCNYDSDNTDKINTPQQDQIFDVLILATGSSLTGYELGKQLGHSIVDPVPSLFTLRMAHDIKKGGLLYDLAGISVTNVRISFKVSVAELSTKNIINAPLSPTKKKRQQFSFTQEGPMLITHEGISGPASLKLSAFAARHFHAANYRGVVTINFAPDFGTIDQVESFLISQKLASPRKFVSSACPLIYSTIDYDNYDLVTDSFPVTETAMIPKRLWGSLCERCGISDTSRWADVSKTSLRSLAGNIFCCTLEVTGKSVNKEEFVTAGGIELKEVDMASMQSKIVDGLFFCGEAVNVDGVTGKAKHFILLGMESLYTCVRIENCFYLPFNVLADGLQVGSIS